MIWVPFKNLGPHGQKEHSPESVTTGGQEELDDAQGGEEEEPPRRGGRDSKEAERVGQNGTRPGKA